MIKHDININGFHSKEHNLVYVPILKNAHMWGLSFFSLNFGCSEPVVIQEKNFKLFEDSIFLVILRDPIDRWISALTQYLIIAFEDPVKILDDLIIKKLITDGIIFDNHAKLQLDELIGIDEQKIVCFRCDENLEKNISNFSLINFNTPTASVGHLSNFNVSAYNDTTQFLYPKIKNMVYEDVEIMNKLKRFYAKDYLLIDNLQIEGSKFQINNLIRKRKGSN